MSYSCFTNCRNRPTVIVVIPTSWWKHKAHNSARRWQVTLKRHIETAYSILTPAAHCFACCWIRSVDGIESIQSKHCCCLQVFVVTSTPVVQFNAVNLRHRPDRRDPFVRRHHGCRDIKVDAPTRDSQLARREPAATIIAALVSWLRCFAGETVVQYWRTDVSTGVQRDIPSQKRKG